MSLIIYSLPQPICSQTLLPTQRAVVVDHSGECVRLVLWIGCSLRWRRQLALLIVAGFPHWCGSIFIVFLCVSVIWFVRLC